MNPLPAKFPTDLDALAHQKATAFARRYLLEFYGEYRMGHFVLAAYAAVPAVLTPDLLYKIWLNFDGYDWGGSQFKVHRIAVADILNSALVEKIGSDQFEMPAALRRAFITWHRLDRERLGMRKLEEVAGFLTQYLAETEGLAARYGPRFLESQNWAALSLTNPEAAAEELKNRLAAAKSPSERLYIADAGQQLGERLTAFFEKKADRPASLAQLALLGTAVEQAVFQQSAAIAKLLKDRPELSQNLLEKEPTDGQAIKIEMPVSFDGNIADARERVVQVEVERVAKAAKTPPEAAVAEDAGDIVVSKSSQPGDAFLWGMDWLERGRRAARAVCRVISPDRKVATGFLIKDGYVLIGKELLRYGVDKLMIEFNFEIGADGNLKKPVTYQIDTINAISYAETAAFKVIDQPENPLNQWGFLEFEIDKLPYIGDFVAIIQHPMGEDKQVSIHDGKITGIDARVLYYSAETMPGSEGAPLFNWEWKVIAVHEGQMAQIEKIGPSRGVWAGYYLGTFEKPPRKLFLASDYAELQTNQSKPLKK